MNTHPGAFYKALAILALTVTSAGVGSAGASEQVSNDVISQQRQVLAKNSVGAGFGPQSPRDIGSVSGLNQRHFADAPAHQQMNLCNIHFHENAEHKGGQFETYAGNGDGKGFGTGFVYSGKLSAAELASFGRKVGGGEHGDLVPGDTIEVHYVYTTAQVEPGPTLGACLHDAIMNPQLRVEAQVFVLVNDDQAADFGDLTAHGLVDGFHQALNIPNTTGPAVQYDGSTTGPGYNQKSSPFQVSWSVRPDVMKVSISSVDKWLNNNVFDEDHAHGVRNLVVNPALLSPIK